MEDASKSTTEKFIDKSKYIYFSEDGKLCKEFEEKLSLFQRLPQEFRIIDNCETEGHFMVLCYGKILLVQSVLL